MSWTYAGLHILNCDASAPFINIFQLMPQKHVCSLLLSRLDYYNSIQKVQTQLHGSSLKYLDQNTPNHCSIPYTGYRFHADSNTNCFLCAMFQWQTPVQHTYPASPMCIHQLDPYALLLIIVYSLFPRWKKVIRTTFICISGPGDVERIAHWN